MANIAAPVSATAFHVRMNGGGGVGYIGADTSLLLASLRLRGVMKGTRGDALVARGIVRDVDGRPIEGNHTCQQYSHAVLAAMLIWNDVHICVAYPSFGSISCSVPSILQKQNHGWSVFLQQNSVLFYQNESRKEFPSSKWSSLLAKSED